MGKISKLLLLAIILAVGFSCSSSAYKATENGFTVVKDSMVVDITCLNEKTIHVQVYPSQQNQKQSMVVDDSQFKFKDFKLSQNNGKVYLETSLLKVEYDTEKRLVTFIDINTGSTILSESQNSFTPVEILGDKAYNVSQTFSLSPDEAIYGLGQFQEGDLNYRGKTVNLIHANREIANPVLLSTNNYLLYWDNYSKTIFSDNEKGATFWSEVGDAVNYYFVYGDNMNDALAGFRALTGNVPMFPKSAFGFWMSRERYRSFDELLGVVSEYRKRKIPLDNIVQDWQYWGADYNQWNSMRFNPEKFDNPQEVIDKLHNEYHVKLTLSVWPGVGPDTEIYRQMDSIGALFDVPTWAGYKVVDIYNPKAQEIYWNQLYKGLYTKGVDSWWMDATEPSFKDGLYQDKQEQWTKLAGQTSIGPFHRYLNTYSLKLSEIMYENLRKQSNKRVSILTRSAFAGQQKYATSTWSGDIYASWDVFKKQISAGLNFCMTGIPYWTTDIGAFRVISQDNAASQGAGELSSYVDVTKKSKDGGYKDGLKDKAYLELYTRWFQYAVFNPMFRAHGTEVPREIWYFGEPGTPYYDAQIEMINLRYSLLSYIYSDSWNVTSKGSTMMRALAMDFTNDKKVYDNADGFMFGDALLVYPITHPMYYDRRGKIAKLDTEVSVYLPQYDGKYWFDFNSDKCYQGGESIKYDAPLNLIPVFVKAGSIVPRNKPVQYANADDNKDMDIVVYAGEDAEFTLYEDDNETYDYETGIYSTITINWNDKTREIVFSAPQGKMTPVLDSRTFNVKVITPDASGSITKGTKSFTYSNKILKSTIQ